MSDLPPSPLEAPPKCKCSVGPAPDVQPSPLETRFFHDLLVSLNAPAGWPGWVVGGVAFSAIVIVAGLWWLLVGSVGALCLGTALIIFTLSDLLVLIILPRRHVSFGPVEPQLFTLELPRLAVATLAAPVALWLGPEPTLIGVVIINLGASLALLRGAFVEPQRLEVSYLWLAGSPLLDDAPSVRMLHISDLHVERFGRREERLLHLVQAIAPDLIVLTGDYINLSYVDDPAAHTDARRVLAGLCTTGEEATQSQVYAVIGSPPVDRNSVSLFDGLPIRLLRDEVAIVDIGQGQRLALLGLDCSHDLECDADRLGAVAAQAPADAFRVLLYHSPELAPIAPKLDINLYLCGHTHGGQVRLPLYGAMITSSRLGKRFDMGHYHVAETHLYVSRGVGLEGMGAPRVRFLCPPEVTLITLNGDGRWENSVLAESKTSHLNTKATGWGER